MQLMKELIIQTLSRETVRIEYPELSMTLSELIEMEAYGVLGKIKAIITDDSRSDTMRVEKIAHVFEELRQGWRTKATFEKGG